MIYREPRYGLLRDKLMPGAQFRGTDRKWGSCYAALMSRVLSLFLGLALLLSMGVSAAAHISEQLCVTGIEAVAAEAEHVDSGFEGDSEQRPADTETGYPHHHGGCHGHHVAMTSAVSGQAAPVLLTSILNPDAVSAVAAHLAESALRPPIA